MICRAYICIFIEFIFIFNTIYRIKQQLNTKPIVSIGEVGVAINRKLTNVLKKK